MIAAYAEFVLDIRAPRSDLVSESALAALTLTDYGDYSDKSSQVRVKYGDSALTHDDEVAGKWTITVGSSVIEEGRMTVTMVGMYGVFAVTSGGTIEGVFPFSFVPISLVPGGAPSTHLPSIEILKDRFEGFPTKFLAFNDTDWMLDSCAVPAQSELGFGALGAWLPVRGQTSCVVHWKGTRPSSMLIIVTLANADPWMRPFSRWICRRMTAAAVMKIASPDREPPSYAACILVDRPGRRRPRDAHETFTSVVYEILDGTPARMN
jgi:hypothetical protein